MRLFWISSLSYCRKWKSICLCLNVESWSEGFLPRSSSPLILHILFSPRWFHSFLLLSAPYQLFPELYLFITFLWLLKQLYHKFGIKQHMFIFLQFWNPEIWNSFTGIKSRCHQDFPGHSVVKTPCFHCRGHGFNPLLGD